MTTGKKQSQRESSNYLLGGGAKPELLGIEFNVEAVAAGGNLLSQLVALLAGILGVVLVLKIYAKHAAEKRTGLG